MIGRFPSKHPLASRVSLAAGYGSTVCFVLCLAVLALPEEAHGAAIFTVTSQTGTIQVGARAQTILLDSDSGSTVGPYVDEDGSVRAWPGTGSFIADADFSASVPPSGSSISGPIVSTGGASAQAEGHINWTVTDNSLIYNVEGTVSANRQASGNGASEAGSQSMPMSVLFHLDEPLAYNFTASAAGTRSNFANWEASFNFGPVNASPIIAASFDSNSGPGQVAMMGVLPAGDYSYASSAETGARAGAGIGDLASAYGTFESLLEMFPCEELLETTAFDVTVTGPTIRAEYTPTIPLDDLAEVCGYTHFNIYQVVVEDPYAPGGLSVPYIDPPSGGGAAFGGFADSLPFYWDENGPVGTDYHLDDNTTPSTLFFEDTPAEPSLQLGEFIEFITFVAGVNANGTWDHLQSVRWSTNFNGSVGGVGVRRNVDTPTSGTGGAFILEPEVDVQSLPQAVLERMIADGVQNVTSAGDFDLDFDVDGFDFLEWQRGFGTIYAASNLADWQASYGFIAPLSTTSAATIPEPTTLLLGAMASIGLMLRRRCLTSP